MTDPEIAKIVGRLPYASNATLLVRMSDGSHAVYKPERGERPLWDFAPGTLAAREVLTYEVSRAMGMEIVPPTVMVDGPLGPGSLQTLVDEDTDADPRLLLEGPDQRLWPFAVLDIVTNNADRKLGHLLIERDTGRVWGIDHGLTFHRDDKLRTMLWGFAGCPLPPECLEAVEMLAADLERDLAGRVADLLSGAESAALAARVAALRRRPVHPEPPVDRPAVPWPMW